MSEFSTVITYLKDLLTADADLVTVAYGLPEDIDMDKNTNFPLAHIHLDGSEIGEGVVAFMFNIHVLKPRVSLTIPTSIQWDRLQNERDNLNDCFNIVNKLILGLRLQRNDFDIELTGATNPEPVTFSFMNLLDGWVVSIRLEITNNASGC